MTRTCTCEHTHRNTWLIKGHVESESERQKQQNGHDDHVQESSRDLQHHPHVDTDLGQLVEEEQEADPGKEHSHRPDLPLGVARAQTLVAKNDHKYERENVQNDLEVVGPVQPVLPVHVDLVPTAITVLALPPVDQLQYLHDEACHSQDYSDGRRKVEEVAPGSGNVCVGRGTDGYIVYTVDTCMSTPPTWLEVATCTCSYFYFFSFFFSYVPICSYF